MEENSSDSICSDDTEYLLGQNVSLREMDDYDEHPSTVLTTKQQGGQYSTSSRQQYVTHETGRSNLKNRNENLLYNTQKQHTKHQSKSTQHQRTKPNELTPPDPRKLQKTAKQKIRGVHDERDATPTSYQTSTWSAATYNKKQQIPNKTETQKASMKSNFEEKHIQQERGTHGQGTKTKLKVETEKEWRKQMSPAPQDQSLEWNQTHDHGSMYGSPEHVDVVSVTSEATEDLLKDDELDSSIIQKLKELNLAVNYDPDTEELFDDKVREGAHLLSKLFGGSIDNYYSSPSAHSGSASGQEISRGESDMTEERRNMSNASSKGSVSYSNTTHQPHPHDDYRNKTSDRNRPKVSFATDESGSFELQSPGQSRNKVVEPNKSSVSMMKSPKQSHTSDEFGGFIRETSALRAAMEYGRDEDDVQSPERHSPSNPHQSRERLFQQQDHLMTTQHDNRFSVEKYSDVGQRKTKSAHDGDQPQWDGFFTSTPHKSTKHKYSPITQIDKTDITAKLYLEKKLHETQDKLNESAQELKEIQLEIEDALSRKKVALQEGQILQDQLKRTKADIKTSENLAEKYKQQVTITRTELMDLEVERDSTRQDIKEMENLLIKQKQEMSEAFKVEKKNERKVMELSLENSKLERELETWKTKHGQMETSLSNDKKILLDKVKMLQEELKEEQKSNKDTIQRLKEQLEEERQNARSSHYERIQSIHKFQDEAKEMQTKEIEALKTRITREYEEQLDKQQEKYNREIDTLKRSVQDGEFRISQLNCTLTAREEEIEVLKTKLLDEKQKLCDCELSYQDEIDKRESHIKALKTELDSLKERESSLTSSNRALEQDCDDKMLEIRRLKEQLQNLVEESSKIEGNQKEEIQMLRSLVRQQEDATRLLGEKMRNEAQEQIRTALQREREAVDRERDKQSGKLTEIKESYEEILTQVRGELENERKNHQLAQTTAIKLKKEVDELRDRNLRSQEDKVAQIGQLRHESKEQIIKLKDKIQELCLLTDKNEKDFVLEINEECRRVASLIGGSPNTTPIKSNSLSSSFTGGVSGESPGSNTNSPAREALANLKSCNAELRQHLLEARKEIDTQKNHSFKQQSDSSELSQQQISLFKKALKSKDDEISRLKRHLHEDVNRSASLHKSERNMMQKTIERLEKELKETKKLIPASSPITNGHSFTDNTSTSGLGTSFSSITGSPRAGDDNSSARLLRHLQGRVQQLRAQNDSLRSDSLNESHSSIGTVDSTFDREGTDDPNLTKKLQSALQLSDQRANKNAAMLSQKMLEMTKLQKMLTHATKENMKLERAYASLQKKMIETSPTSL